MGYRDASLDWEAEHMNCYVTEAWWELFNKGL